MTRSYLALLGCGCDSGMLSQRTNERGPTVGQNFASPGSSAACHARNRPTSRATHPTMFFRSSPSQRATTADFRSDHSLVGKIHPDLPPRSTMAARYASIQSTRSIETKFELGGHAADGGLGGIS